VDVDWRKSSVRDVYQAPRYHYFGAEPVYVGGGEQGMIICHIFDSEHVSSHFALFDAYRVAEGPVAKVRAPCPVHLGFHATFTAASP
jgi:carotenoid cleavage dioxygenase-like enzyme